MEEEEKYKKKGRDEKLAARTECQSPKRAELSTIKTKLNQESDHAANMCNVADGLALARCLQCGGRFGSCSLLAAVVQDKGGGKKIIQNPKSKNRIAT